MCDFWHETGAVYFGEVTENDVGNTLSRWENNVRRGEQIKPPFYQNISFDTYLY